MKGQKEIRRMRVLQYYIHIINNSCRRVKQGRVLTVIIALIVCATGLSMAQGYGTGKRVIKVEGGRKISPKRAIVDTLRSDSLTRDSLVVDSLAYDSLTTDSLMATDSLITTGSLTNKNLSTDSLSAKSAAQDTALIKTDATRLLNGKNKNEETPKDELQEKVRKRFNLLRDTMSSGNVTWISLVVPGFGQIYNRQWWKVPIIYAGLGGFITAGVVANNRYTNFKGQYQQMKSLHMPDYVVNQAKIKMENAGTMRTAMFAMAGVTYLYSLADQTFCYRGKVNPIRKATMLAALFPGAGFIYTQTYWRIPIYYGAGAALATVIDYNARSYTRYNNAFKAVTDNDPTTVDEFNGRYSGDMLKNVKDSYRRNRDLAIIGTVAVYLISIVDTHVIATLKNWDMSEDLSIKVEPTIIDNAPTFANSGTYKPVGFGMSLKVKF